MPAPYTPPLVEQWVSNTFLKAQLLYPSDLTAKSICRAFGITYGFYEGMSGAKIINQKPYIAVDTRIPLPEQHEEFLHELGHVLRHSGDQVNMPDTLRLYQEWDANLFALYAAIPLHMIDFDNGYSISSLMDEFNVTEGLVLKRVDDIRQKTYWEKKRKQETRAAAYTPFSINNCTEETKRIMRQLGKQTGVNYV